MATYINWASPLAMFTLGSSIHWYNHILIHNSTINVKQSLWRFLTYNTTWVVYNSFSWLGTSSNECSGSGSILVRKVSNRKESFRHGTYSSVGQVSRQHSREAITDEITKVAERLSAALEDTRQSAPLVRVTKGHDGDNSLLNCSGETVSSNVGDLSALTVIRVSRKVLVKVS